MSDDLSRFAVFCCVALLSGCGLQPSDSGPAGQLADVRGVAGVHWSSSIESGVPALVTRQAQRLATLPSANPEFTDLASRMGMRPPRTSGELESWWRARTRYVVLNGEANEALSRNLSSIERYPGSFAGVDGDFTTVAMNLSAEIYTVGKHRQRVMTALIPGVGGVLIHSPRVGIIGLTQETLNTWKGLNATDLEGIATVWGTWLHEARHGDGTGENLGFAHQRCPPGLGEFSGKILCDRFSNGAYGIELAFYRWILAQAPYPSDAILNRRAQLIIQSSTGSTSWSPSAGQPEFESLIVR